jgi:hypothetical protein
VAVTFNGDSILMVSNTGGSADSILILNLKNVNFSAKFFNFLPPNTTLLTIDSQNTHVLKRLEWIKLGNEVKQVSLRIYFCLIVHDLQPRIHHIQAIYSQLCHSDVEFIIFIQCPNSWKLDVEFLFLLLTADGLDDQLLWWYGGLSDYSNRVDPLNFFVQFDDQFALVFRNFTWVEGNRNLHIGSWMK